MTTDQQVSSTWYLNGANQNNNAQAWSYTWDILGQYNVTYVGANDNGSVSIIWNVSVVTFSPYDVNRDGYINEADLDVIALHFGEVTAVPYPRGMSLDMGLWMFTILLRCLLTFWSDRKLHGDFAGNIGAASGWRVRYFKIGCDSG